MPNVQRVGDANNVGGEIVSTLQTNTYANGILISVDGSTVSTHTPNIGLHTIDSCRTDTGSSNVFINNKKVTITGGADNCSHTRSGGSPNVFVN